MAARPRHPSKQIEEAISYAEDKGWRVEKAGARAHSWGRLLCPLADESGCIVFVYTTPRDDDNHARKVKRLVDKCTCMDEAEEAEPPPEVIGDYCVESDDE